MFKMGKKPKKQLLLNNSLFQSNIEDCAVLTSLVVFT